MKSARTSSPNQSPQAEPAPPVPVWDGDDYDHVTPGEYTATIVDVGALEWTRWHRWNVTVTYQLDSGERVPGYYSLGEDRARARVGRKCRYWNLYHAALRKPPEPGAMPPEVLLSRQVRIKVKTSEDGRYSSVAAESALESPSMSEPVSLSVSSSESLSVSVSGNQAQAQARCEVDL